MSHREEQFVSFMKRELAAFLDRTVVRPAGSFFSITHVALDQAGTRADVWISIYPEKFSTTIMKTLKAHEGESRKHLSALLKRRQIPFLRFVLDESQSKQIRLEKLLENKEN